MARIFKCPHCGGDINPGGMMGSILTDKKLKAIRENAKKAGRPKGSKNKPKDAK